MSKTSDYLSRAIADPDSVSAAKTYLAAGLHLSLFYAISLGLATAIWTAAFDGPALFYGAIGYVVGGALAWARVILAGGPSQAAVVAVRISTLRGMLSFGVCTGFLAWIASLII